MQPLDFYDLLKLIEERHDAQADRIGELEIELAAARDRIGELLDELEDCKETTRDY